MKNAAIILLCFVGLLVLTIAIVRDEEVSTIRKNGVYVIGYIERFYYSTIGRRASQNEWVEVVYEYQGKTFHESTPVQVPTSHKSRRVFIQLLPQNPRNIIIEFYVYVPDTLLTSSYDGWKELPVPRSIYPSYK